MVNKLTGRPMWYKIWAISVGIAAIYVLINLFTDDGLGQLDFILMFYTHASILLDLYFFPDSRKPADWQKSD